MPSCVVKCCRNHSGRIKKSQGITFHRFPSSNDTWKNDWVQIIKESRKESGWIPSKSSVICNIHFEESDLYTTKGGLFRVVAYAVPKKFLYETSSNQVQQSEEILDFIGDFKNSRRIPEANISSTSHGVPLEASNIEVDKLAKANTFSASHESVLVVGESSLQGLTLRQSCRVLLNTNSIDLRSSLPQESSKGPSKTVTPPSGVELEQPLSVLYTPKQRRMKERLMKMRTLILSHKKKIKTLNQKVRRLQDRNKSLKDILKTLKEENYVDSDLFNRLNGDITAANILNNYNKRKLNNKVKYSPSMKKFCLTLNYYSPKAYDYVRQTFNTCLPDRKTLAKWYGRINANQGLLKNLFRHQSY